MMRNHSIMRTTMNLDEDVLWAAKGTARLRGIPMGQVVSNLARQGLAKKRDHSPERIGVPLLPPRADARPVSLAVVNALRDGDA